MWKFFEGLLKPFPFNQSVQPPTRFLKFIKFYTRGVWKYLLIVTIISSLIAVGEALFFYFMGHFVDLLNASTPETFWQKNWTTVALFIVMVGLVLPFMIALHDLFLNQTLRANFPMRIRFELHRYILRQSMSFFANDFAGRLSQKLQQTAMGIRDTVIKMFDVIVHMFVYFIIMLGMLADANVYLMLIMLIWLFIYILIMSYFIPKLRVRSKEIAEKRSSMIGSVVDSYTNIQTVKLFSKMNKEEFFAKKQMGKCLVSEYKLFRLITLFDVSVQINNYILICTLVLVSIYLWTINLVLVGSIAVSLGLAIRANNLSQWVMWEVGMLFDSIGNVQNGMDSIAKPVTVKDPENPIGLPTNIKGDIEFKNVVFSYNGISNVINNLSLTIRAGEKIGIVGHSGGGKTTLVNLLLRFYDIQNGSITIDGIDIKHIKMDDLRSVIAMVTQDTALLHRSVRENILYGNEKVDDLDNLMRCAAKQAKADEFIDALSDGAGNTGYEAKVGERGVRLSGGQRQRIALARVILKNAPILILDEATSALDSEVEAAVKESLDKLMENKTVIAIAHRLSTIAAMDRLIVLKEGQIAEIGTHEELLKLDGVYASLWNKQTNGFIGK